jgi:Na+/H+-dicarboxylate symporter
MRVVPGKRSRDHYRIIAIVMGFAPIGVFALIAWATAAGGSVELLPLAK